jgi:hypothetical protein
MKKLRKRRQIRKRRLRRKLQLLPGKLPKSSRRQKLDKSSLRKIN